MAEPDESWERRLPEPPAPADAAARRSEALVDRWWTEPDPDRPVFRRFDGSVVGMHMPDPAEFATRTLESTLVGVSGGMSVMPGGDGLELELIVRKAVLTLQHELRLKGLVPRPGTQLRVKLETEVVPGEVFEVWIDVPLETRRIEVPVPTRWRSGFEEMRPFT